MEKVLNVLKNAQRVAIFMHIRPDGDTIGSSLGLRLALKSLGKEADCYVSEQVPEKFSYLSGFSDIKNSAIASEYDCFLAVDCSDEYRMGGYINAFLKHKNTAIIDHHKSNTRFAKSYYIKPDYAATAILAGEIIGSLGVQYSKEIAECLYTGLSTDTGNFSHSNTDKQVFTLACRLVDCNINVSMITTSLYKSSSKARMKLLGKVISNMRFYVSDSVSIITITKKDMQEYSALPQDTEGFIDYAIGIAGVNIACCILEHSQNCYKVSLRAKSLDVCKIAMEFGGGGHTLAAGCMISGFYEDVVDKLIRAIEMNP